MAEEDEVTTERTIPSYPVGVTFHVDFNRNFVDVGDLVAWFSLVIAEAPKEELWILNRIRKEFIDISKSNPKVKGNSKMEDV